MEPLSHFEPGWDQATDGFASLLLRRFLRDLSVAFGVFSFLELFLRILPGVPFYIYTSEFTGGHPWDLNTQGYRSVEFGSAVPDGLLPIVFLGDSTTWGAGVPMHLTFASRVGEGLTSQGHRYLAINASGQGGSCWEMLEFSKRKLPDLHPALVILTLNPAIVPLTISASADPIRKINWWQEILAVHVALRRSYVYSAVDFFIRGAMYRLDILVDRMDKKVGSTYAMAFKVDGISLSDVLQRYAALESCIEAVARVSKTSGAPLLLVSLPVRFMLSRNNVDNERGFDLSRIRIDPEQKFFEMAARLQLPIIDVGAELRRERTNMLNGSRSWDDLYVPGDYAHLNSEGMRIAAAAILKGIERHKLLRMPATIP